MKVDPGQGTEEELALASLRGSAGRSSTTLSGGVFDVYAVELSRLGLCSGLTYLRAIMAEYVICLRQNGGSRWCVRLRMRRKYAGC